MNRYVLVSLWAEDDDATRASHGFAQKLGERRAPARFVHGQAPPIDHLEAAARDAKDAAVVIFSHGGSALSARCGGQPWIGPKDLATRLTGRRVYAFACSTFVPHTTLLLSTFAQQAVDACIDVFVGHEAPVMAPLAGTVRTQQMEEALFALIDRFIDGEDDEKTLSNIGRMHGASDLVIELDLPSEDPRARGLRPLVVGCLPACVLCQHPHADQAPCVVRFPLFSSRSFLRFHR